MKNMNNELNWNALTPAVFAIYEANGAKGGITDAANMAQRNIMEGANLYPGAEALPEEHRPAWDELGGLEAVQGGNDAFNVWRRKLLAHDSELYDLYTAGDFAAMAALMEQSADPGLVGGGEAPAQDE